MGITADKNTAYVQALRMEEAVQFTAMSRSSLYRAMADRRLRSIKIGKSRRFMIADLQSFLEEGRDER